MRLLRTAAVGAIAIGLPLAIAACGSSPSSVRTTSAGPATVSANALVGAGCKAIPATTISALRRGKGIADVLKNPMFEQLFKEVGKGNVGPLFNSMGQLTIIAPTNRAFTKMPKAMANSLKTSNNLMMTLRGLVVGLRITPEMYIKGARVPSLAGNLIHFTRPGNTYEVNGTQVECGNIKVGTATVYIVGSVLSLPK